MQALSPRLAAAVGCIVFAALTAPTRVAAEAKPCEVLVIGTVHAPPSLLSDLFTPAHVRATLEKFRPTAVGVEAMPEWLAAGVFFPVTYEAQEVAVPWAEEHSVPVYGIDWQEPQVARADQTPSVASPQSIQELLRRARATASSLLQQTQSPQRNLFGWINGRVGRRAIGRWYHPGPEASDELRAEVAAMAHRNDRVVERILEAARRHPGGRLAVVIGGLHKPDLDAKLALHLEVRVVQLEDLPPIGDGDVAAARRPRDAVAIANECLDGSGFWANPRGVDRKRVERWLAYLASTSPNSPAEEYFRARLHAVRGEYDEAKALLLPLAVSTNQEPLAYRGQNWFWLHLLGVSQRARVEMGRLCDLQGRRTEAVRWYRLALEELRANPPKRISAPASAMLNWYNQNLQRSYQEGMDVLALLLREPYTNELDGARPVEVPRGRNLLADPSSQMSAKWRHRAQPTDVARYERGDGTSLVVECRKDEAGPCYWAHSVAVAGEGEYVLAGDIETEGLSEQATVALCVQCRNAAGKQIGFASTAQVPGQFAPSHEWTSIGVRFTAPAGTAKLVTFAMLNGRGTARFRSVRLVAVPVGTAIHP